MNAEGFKNWLLASGMKETAAQNRVSNCATVERGQHIDLDLCYERNRCQSLIELLTYSREDQRRNRLPRHNIPIEGNVYNGTATYKAAVKKYVAFRDAEGKVQDGPASPRKVFPNAQAGTISSIAVAEKKVPCADFKKVLRDFRKWLIDEAGLKPNSADQYKTYLNKLRVAADKHFGRGWFESLPSMYVKNLSELELRQCSGFIENRIQNARSADRKSWKDWRSAFHRFEEYLHDRADVYNFDFENAWKDKICKDKVRKSRGTTKIVKTFPDVKNGAVGSVIATYSDKELYRAFMGRLKTQSRFYPGIGLLFPTRLLTKIFCRTRPNAWIEWLRRDIECMHVIKSDDGGGVRFANVLGMEIRDDGSVAVMTRGGESFQLMTRTARGGIVAARALRGLRDVSIDHVEPLENVLRRNKKNLNGLKRLSELFASYKQESGENIDERAERTWIHDFYAKFADELSTRQMRECLEADLQKLKLAYELMDTTENSRKGNGV